MNRRGMTLVEMLVTMGILALLGGVLVMAYLAMTRLQRDESNRVEVDVDASRILATIDGYIRQGRQILGSATINSTLYTTGTTTLVFTIPSQVAGQPSPTQSDTAVLSQESNVLVLILEPAVGTDRTAFNTTVATKVKDVYFRYTSADPTAATSLSVTLQTSQALTSGEHTQSSIVYGTIRNHP